MHSVAIFGSAPFCKFEIKLPADLWSDRPRKEAHTREDLE